MKQILPTLGRFLIISLASLGAATFANQSNHKEYWYRTITNVQTTDFNILSHTLPTKLSLTLINRDLEELQRTLDSNYGLFGMVVTDCKTVEPDCPEQQILYSSNSEREWKKQLSLEKLAGSPYSSLRNPPPIATESGFSDARDRTWEATGKTNPGEIIGRVYYVRGIPPSFWVEYQQWISKLPISLFSDRGAQKYYALTVSLFGASGLAAFSFIEWLLYRKRTEKRQAQKERKQLLKQLEQVRQQLRERLRQVSTLIAQREEFLSELTARQQQENQTTQQLGQMTTQLEEQLAQQKQLAQQQQSKTLEKAFSTLREENEQNKETISDLQEQIAQAQTQNQDGNRKNVEALQQQLEAVQQRNQVVHAQGREYKTMIERLHEEIAESERKQRETEQLVTFLRTQVEEAERREQDADRKRQEMEKTVAELNQEKEGDKQDLHLLEERIEELRQKEALEDSLNDFERSVLACLQNSLKFQTERWRVHDQFDVSEKKRSRRVTDFIVVSQSCIFIIEAKYYLGRISAEGDAKNTPWICQPTTGSNKLVKSSGGNNPYKQVLNYTDSMRRRVDWNKSTGKVGIYGIVVFPEGADVSRLRSEIGGSHYEITTLERLVDLIQNIEREIVSYNPDQVSLLSVEQLDNLICGRPVKKQLSSS